MYHETIIHRSELEGRTEQELLNMGYLLHGPASGGWFLATCTCRCEMDPNRTCDHHLGAKVSEGYRGQRAGGALGDIVGEDRIAGEPD